MVLITEAREKIINEWDYDASNLGINNPMEIVSITRNVTTLTQINNVKGLLTH
jgi:hypothetical protein